MASKIFTGVRRAGGLPLDHRQARSPGAHGQIAQQTLGRWFPSLKIATLDRIGHYPMTETPPYFVKQVEDFIAAAA